MRNPLPVCTSRFQVHSAKTRRNTRLAQPSLRVLPFLADSKKQVTVSTLLPLRWPKELASMRYSR